MNDYTDEKNAQIVLSLLKEYGIRYIVASPGSTNIPILGSIQNDNYFTVYSSVDERSAAYLACGIAAETGETVVLSCTGATASRNYLSGLTEAYYRKLPILALTSMHEVEGIGNLKPQVIDRSILPKDTVKGSYLIDIVKDKKDFSFAVLQVNKALSTLVRNGGGPVHINLISSYLGTFSTKKLPEVRKINYSNSDLKIDVMRKILNNKKICLFIGSHSKFDHQTLEEIELFVRNTGAIVLADHTSNYRGEGKILSALPSTNLSSQHDMFEELKPEVILHIGEVSGDYPSMDFLSRSKADVIRISEDGEFRDLFGNLKYVFEKSEEDFFNQLNQFSIDRRINYMENWKQYTQNIIKKIPTLPFSNTWIAQNLSPLVPKKSVLYLGILNTLRNWNYFQVDDSVSVYSNVGGFGIDGGLSTLIGMSLVDTTKLCFCVLGDLSFFYDMNVLGNRHIGKNIRILLINNESGTEFKNSTHIGANFGDRANQYIAAGGHFTNQFSSVSVETEDSPARSWCESLGFKYLRATSKEEYSNCVKDFLSTESDRPIILECFTNSNEESTALELMANLDNKINLQGRTKQAVKKIIPNNIKNVIKGAITQ